MVDWDTIRELAPHYLAMVLLVFVALTILRAAVGDLGFWIELVIVVAVVFAYRPVVHYFDVAPSAWSEQREARVNDER